MPPTILPASSNGDLFQISLFRFDVSSERKNMVHEIIEWRIAHGTMINEGNSSFRNAQNVRNITTVDTWTNFRTKRTNDANSNERVQIDLWETPELIRHAALHARLICPTENNKPTTNERTVRGTQRRIRQRTEREVCEIQWGRLVGVFHEQQPTGRCGTRPAVWTNALGYENERSLVSLYDFIRFFNLVHNKLFMLFIILYYQQWMTPPEISWQRNEDYPIIDTIID